MKLLMHSRDKVGDFQDRVLLHVPIGFLMGLFPFDTGLKDIFIRYEENEDLHEHDKAWKDYFGAMVGYVLGRFTLIGLIIWLILRVRD